VAELAKRPPPTDAPMRPKEHFLRDIERVFPITCHAVRNSVHFVLVALDYHVERRDIASHEPLNERLVTNLYWFTVFHVT
jgi:hypothetical protein